LLQGEERSSERLQCVLGQVADAHPCYGSYEKGRPPPASFGGFSTGVAGPAPGAVPPVVTRPAPVRTGASPATHMLDRRVRPGVRDRAGRHGSVGLPTEGSSDGGSNDELTYDHLSSLGNCQDEIIPRERELSDSVTFRYGTAVAYPKAHHPTTTRKAGRDKWPSIPGTPRKKAASVAERHRDEQSPAHETTRAAH
jgi:hypothetical protein